MPDSMLLLQSSVDVLMAYLQLSIKFKIDFLLQAGTAVVVMVLKRLQDKLSVIEKPRHAPLDLRVKVEIKILIDFVKKVLLEPSLVAQLYLQYDFTCVRRPLIASLLSTSVKVCQSNADI